MYIRKTKTKGKTYYQVVEKNKGKLKVLAHLGTIENILKNHKAKEE